ncbi:MAG: glycosyltransferase [Polyangia bacterium]
MTDRVRVLVYGGIAAEACPFYRRGIFLSHLANLGVDLIPWTPPLTHPQAYAGRWVDAIRDGVARVDYRELANANIVLFSRWSNTFPACTACGAECGSLEGLESHNRDTRHGTLSWDPLLRLLLPALLADASLRSRCAVMYDLDDDLFHQPEWVGHGPGLARALDLVELLIRAADLVTVSTPVLERLLQPLTARIHVIRNAIDPDLYRTDVAAAPAGDDPGDDPRVTRVLFYGADVRRRDYAVCKAAVDKAARARRRTRRIWLGSDSPAVRALVDEALPKVETGAPFGAALANLHPHVGLAPLEPGPFASAKSELHWLEYAMVGAATVASRLPTAGPYDVIEDGRDGLLAAGAADWRRAVMRLVSSTDLRTEIAGRARERVLAEYQAAERAENWAAAYRWAANHPGIGPRL